MGELPGITSDIFMLADIRCDAATDRYCQISLDISTPQQETVRVTGCCRALADGRPVLGVRALHSIVLAQPLGMAVYEGIVGPTVVYVAGVVDRPESVL